MSKLRLVFYFLFISVLAQCSPRSTAKFMPPVELEYTDGLLTFIAKQVIEGESFGIVLNPYGHSVGLTFTPIVTDSTHQKLAELIYKNILSKKEFSGHDGMLAFRTDAFYGFASCRLNDLENISLVKFAEIIDKKVSYILKVEKLWREIMLLGGRKHYTNGVG